MVHEIYRRVLPQRYMNSAPQSLFEALSVAKRLPPPDELTTDFIVEFLNSYDNINTHAYYTTSSRVSSCLFWNYFHTYRIEPVLA